MKSLGWAEQIHGSNLVDRYPVGPSRKPRWLTRCALSFTKLSLSAEQGVLAACAELGIGFVPFSPLGKGFLTGTVDISTTFAANDLRAQIPRFSSEALQHNLALVEEVKAIAAAKGVTPGEIALAWLLAQTAVDRAYSRHNQTPPTRGEPRRRRPAKAAANAFPARARASFDDS